LLPNLGGACSRGERLGKLPLCQQHRCTGAPVVGDHDLVRSQNAPVDLDRASDQRLGLRELVSGHMRRGESVQQRSDLDLVFPASGFKVGQRLAVQRFRFGEPFLVQAEIRDVVQAGPTPRVARVHGVGFF
jgi:hypothetical protein